MPVEFIIDKKLKVVFSIAHGIITDHEAYSHQDKLRDDPDFKSNFSQLFDCTKITDANNISTEAINRLADRNPFGLGAKRVFVAPSDLMYGLVRMFQILTNDHPDELTVFRDIQDARKYLSLD